MNHFAIIAILITALISILTVLIIKELNKRKPLKERKTLQAYIVSIDKLESSENYCYYLKGLNVPDTFISYGNLSKSTYGSMLEITINGFDKVLEIKEISGKVGTKEVSELEILDRISETKYVLEDEQGNRIFEHFYGELYVKGDKLVRIKYIFDESFHKTIYEFKKD